MIIEMTLALRSLRSSIFSQPGRRRPGPSMPIRPPRVANQPCLIGLLPSRQAQGPGAGGATPGALSWIVMEGRQPNRLGESLTRRQKRVFAAAGAVLVIVLGGVGVWAATDPG